MTPAIRTAHIGIQAALLSLGLFLMFAAAGIVAVVLEVAAINNVKDAETTLADLRDSTKHEELKRIQGAAAAINNPRATARIEAVLAKQRDEAADRRSALLAPQRVLLDGLEKAMDSTPPRDREATLKAEGTLLVWAAASEKSAAGKGDSPWQYKAGQLWGVLFIVPLMWILTAALLRGGLSMMITGIAVVRSDGRRAFRRQCAFRAALVWLPLAALLLACVWLQVYRYHLAYLYATLWLVAVGLLPIYVLLALRDPSRPPQDRIAGTSLVPA